jgi:hypothetical protein
MSLLLVLLVLLPRCPYVASYSSSPSNRRQVSSSAMPACINH